MNTKKYIAPVGVAALAVATMLTTACGAPTETRAASTSSSATAASSSADEALRRVVPYGAERMDRAAARAALEAGKPFLVSLPDGGVEACHSALLLPGDARPWILNESAVRVAGNALMAERLQTYGCGVSESVPSASIPAPAPDTAMDTAAAESARAAGRPFIYALPDGLNSVCNVAVIVGDEEWFLNRSTGPSAKGDALSQIQRGYGCTNGETVPGVPAN
ncbi:hypothetical protein A5637_29235 [Mycolicibacterium fortuitum]|uniref:hypothetical protein n=1 Tax=Mycolicibacterium fortuitum TaxID=1766 RepID=UPI0007EDD9E7|nr:hypothetical protein [Mycolicibacterium fortuitum]OBK09602.1 hypothetical protein A5637_29235 [Mycolicibacterium fortuitum]